MTALTVADMTTAFRALETLAETHPGLPYAGIAIRGTTLVAEQVIDVQLWRDPDGFVAWCEAFDVDTDSLSAQSTGFNYFTQAVARYAGVTWVIILDHLDREWRPALAAPEAVAA